MVQAPTTKRWGTGSPGTRPPNGSDLIETHRGLIHAYARKRVKSGVEEDDLFQAGAIAIIEAGQAHDPDKGAFSTIADFYLKVEMNEAEANGSIATPASLPRSTLGRVRRIKGAISRLHSAGAGRPGESEIAKEAGLSHHRVEGLLPLTRSTLSPGVYLSTPVGEDGDGELWETLPSGAEDPGERACQYDDRRRLLRAVETLPQHEREVIEAYYGLGGREGRDMGVLSRRMGVSKQALHQRLCRARGRLGEALQPSRRAA